MGDLGAFLTHTDPNFKSVRIPALYSDFREQRTKAPTFFQQNVDAWKGALCSIAWSGPALSNSETNHLSINVNGNLLQRLKVQRFNSPQALGTVIRECLASRDAYRLNDFINTKRSIYSYNMSGLPWAAVSWVAGQVWSVAGFCSSGEDRLESGQFVLMQNIIAAYQKLVDVTEGLTTQFERTYTKDKFIELFASRIIDDGKLSPSDMELLLIFASRDKGTIVYDGKTVRIKGPGDKDNSITEEDSSVASLKSLVEDLQQQTELMSTRIETLTQQAKDALAKKNKVAALAALKSKKLTESALEQRFATLHQLEAVVVKLEQAADNVQMVKNMESATSVLKNLNAESGGVDRVDEVVQNLRDTMAEVDEVGTVLADANNPGLVVDEEELDEELAAMEASEKAKDSAEEERAKAAARERVMEDMRQAQEVAELGKLLDTVSVPQSSPAGAEEEALDAFARMSLKEEELA